MLQLFFAFVCLNNTHVKYCFDMINDVNPKLCLNTLCGGSINKFLKQKWFNLQSNLSPYSFIKIN